MSSVEFRRNVSFNNVTNHQIGKIDVLSALENTFLIGEKEASNTYICNATSNDCTTEQVAITTWDSKLYTTKKYLLWDTVIISGSRIALILSQPLRVDMFSRIAGTKTMFAIKSFSSDELTATQTLSQPTSLSVSDRGTIITTDYPRFVFVGPDYNGTTELKWTALNRPMPIANAVKISKPDEYVGYEYNADAPFFLWVMRRKQNLTWDSPTT